MPATRSQLAVLTLLLISLGACQGACRRHADRAATVEDPAQFAEPERYSATISITIEEGDRREASMTRIARSGEMLRQEWDEQGDRLALIWRPDLGKSFLVSTTRRAYVERDDRPDDPRRVDKPSAGDEQVQPEQVERAFRDAPPAVSVQTRALPDQTVDGWLCKVSERRAVFADGHTEVVRAFRAGELAGLPVRIESETDEAGRRVRVVTERRDIRTEVSPDEFTIPRDFRRVDKLFK